MRKTTLLLSFFALLLLAPTAAQAQDLVINEFMADPNGAVNTDLNDNGSAGTDDEFVEILNNGSSSIDLSGYQLDDEASGGASPYNFPSGTMLASGEYAVIINDANGQTFGAFTDSGVPSLNNGGDDIRLLDDQGNVVTSISYTSSQAYEGVSAARNPDGTGSFERQDGFGTMPSETAGQNNETGAGNSGSGSAGSTVQFTSAGATVNEGDGSTTIGVSLQNSDGTNTSVDVQFDSGESSASSSDIGGYTTQTVTFDGSSDETKTVTVNLTDDSNPEGTETANFDLANASGASIGSPSSYDLAIQDNEQADVTGALVISEFMADPSDVNDSDGEYFEIYNRSADPIDIDGYTFSDNGSNSFTIGTNGETVGGSTTTVPSDDFYVLCRNGDSSTNGGVLCDYEWTSFTLSNSGDEILIDDGTGTDVFDLTYTDGNQFEPASNELINTDDGADGTADGSDYQAAQMNIDGSGDDLGSPQTAGTTQATALPVELTSFTATADGAGAALLAWRTASETNNARFEIQRQAPKNNVETFRRKVSTTDGKWQTVGSREGAGTTAEAQSYSFRAAGLAAGTHRFRLVQVDLDGARSPSDARTVRIAPQGRLALGAVHPNPIRTQAQFRVVAPEPTDVTVALYDALGRRVATVFEGEATEATLTLRAGDLPAGVYVLRARGAGVSRTQAVTLVR